MEKWKRIKGYENLYVISNEGRVFSLPRQVKKSNGQIQNKTGRILKLKTNSTGYLRVILTNEQGKNKRFFIHRLVAEHFVERKNAQFNIVNHLDCNPQNNKADNLEWTTLKGNSQYMCKLGRNKRTQEWKDKTLKALVNKYGKAVIGTSINTNEIIQFDYVNQARKYGYCPSSISQCCNGKRQSHKGYIWRFKDE